jgi:hypothetical protein
LLILSGVNSAIFLAAVALAASCGQPAMYMPPPIEQPVPTASGPPPPLADDPATQVEQLHGDVVARRSALALPAPPPPPEVTCEPVCAVEDPPAARSCTPGEGSACAATCTQADTICDDATKICSVAKELRTDALAAGRCHDANATCIEARAACCGCK